MRQLAGATNTRKPMQVHHHLHNIRKDTPHETLYATTAFFVKGSFAIVLCASLSGGIVLHEKVSSCAV